MKATLSENIKDLRKLSGISQVDFANKMNVTKQCVSNWENDNVLPSIEMLVKIADFFKVSTDYMLGKDSNKLLDCSNLSDEQYTHILLLVKDLEKTND